MIRQENLETGQFDMVSGKKLDEAIASILNAHPSIERVRMRCSVTDDLYVGRPGAGEMADLDIILVGAADGQSNLQGLQNGHD